MKTPNKIYLIDFGDEIVWCDDPNQAGCEDPHEFVEYVKAIEVVELNKDLAEAESAVDDLMEGLEAANEKIAAMQRAIDRFCAHEGEGEIIFCDDEWINQKHIKALFGLRSKNE